MFKRKKASSVCCIRSTASKFCMLTIFLDSNCSVSRNLGCSVRRRNHPITSEGTSLESTMLLCQPLPSFRHFLLFRHRYGSRYHTSSCLLLVSLKPRRSSSTTTSPSSLWMWNSQNTMSMNNSEIISSFATHPLHQEHIQWQNPSLFASGATPSLAATQSSLRSSSSVPFPIPNTNNPTSANSSLHTTNHYHCQQQQQLSLDGLMQHIPFAIQRRKQQNIPVGSKNDPILQLLR
jgi:hypothetical protein